MPEMCRLGRVVGELVGTAGVPVRTLERSQQKPAPFFGTVLADAVDVVALDAAWGQGSPGLLGDGPVQRSATPRAAMEVDPVGPGAGGGAAEDAAGAKEVPTAGTAVAEMAMTGERLLISTPFSSRPETPGWMLGRARARPPEGIVPAIRLATGWGGERVLGVARVGRATWDFSRESDGTPCNSLLAGA